MLKMPELPEVETMCRGLAPIVGRQLSRVFCPECAYRPISIKPGIRSIARRLDGQRVTHIRRLGKRVVILFGPEALILQPKMSGLVALGHPPDVEHVRLEMEFVGKPNLRLLFWDRRGLGTVELMAESEIQERIVHGRLGPDALSISFDDFSRRLSATARPIKVALLDQKLVAGIGNLYDSEMLHVARIHPATPAKRISNKKKLVLYQAMREILQSAIEHEGSTLSDATYRNALNDPGSYQQQHRVYDRAGQTCPSCGKGVIERIVQSQRSSFLCPRCQR